MRYALRIKVERLKKKRMAMNITVRKLGQEDDLGVVSNLIYETDNYIFPHFFNDSKTSAKEILPYMIDSDTIYNRNNIYVALNENEIIGIMVINESPVQINLSAFIDSFEKAGGMIDEAFEKVLKEYYLPLEDEAEGYFIANICIDSAYRGHGVGGAMLETVLCEVDTSKDVYLECLVDNKAALAVYENHGFEILFEYSGFTGLPYYKMIRRANRELL